MSDPVDSSGPGWLSKLLGITDSAPQDACAPEGAEGERPARAARAARSRASSQDDTVDLGTSDGGLSAPAPANQTSKAPESPESR